MPKKIALCCPGDTRLQESFWGAVARIIPEEYLEWCVQWSMPRTLWPGEAMIDTLRNTLQQQIEKEDRRWFRPRERFDRGLLDFEPETQSAGWHWQAFINEGFSDGDDYYAMRAMRDLLLTQVQYPIGAYAFPLLKSEGRHEGEQTLANFESCLDIIKLFDYCSLNLAPPSGDHESSQRAREIPTERMHLHQDRLEQGMDLALRSGKQVVPLLWDIPGMERSTVWTQLYLGLLSREPAVNTVMMWCHLSDKNKVGHYLDRIKDSKAKIMQFIGE